MDKTIIFPNWDNLSGRLLVANLRREGFDARLLQGSPESLQKGLRYNTGQCIPINIMAQEFIDYIEKNDLDPSRCILWMIRGEIACNLKVIPHHIKSMLNMYGRGMEHAEVYQGDISFLDISVRAAINAYFAYMFGGLLRRVACKIRPYEIHKGSTDRILEAGMGKLYEAFLTGGSKEDVLKEIIRNFEKIAIEKTNKPKVAIFGDIYVRDNDPMNQDLIHYIEEHGGEVITTPYTTYAKMIAKPYLKKWLKEGKYFYTLSSSAMLAAVQQMEKRYYKYFQRILKEPDHEFNDSVEKILGQYSLIPEHTGESMDNILKVYYIKKYYPDVALFIQTSPAFCCPALVTEAMSKAIEKNTGVPVVSLTYDGTCGNKNSAIIPYLKYHKRTQIAEELEKADLLYI